MGESSTGDDKDEAYQGKAMNSYERDYNARQAGYDNSNDQAIAQLQARQTRADAMSMLQNPFESGATGFIADQNRANMIDKLEKGGEPVFDANGQVQGVFSNDGLFGGRVYSGNPVAGMPETGWNAGGNDAGGSVANRSLVDPLQAARDRRATAYANRNKALQDAFGAFNDDYYNDLTTAFRDVNSTGIQSAYDDALRGIYQGFKQQGIFSQGDFDAQVRALDAQKAIEESRIEQAAKDYADQQRKTIADQQTKMANSLSGILGGANTQAEIDAQTDAVNAFSFDNDIAKLKAAGPEAQSMDFFSGYNKVAAPTVAGAQPENVAPLSPAAFGGSALVNTTGSSGVSTGVASPFSGSSVKVI